MPLDRELSFRLPMSMGDDVRQVQQALALADTLRVGGADGIFGPGTRDAVIAFQRQMQARNPAIVVDGIVGRDTWSALFSQQAAAITAPGISVPAAFNRPDGKAWRPAFDPFAKRLSVRHGAPARSATRQWSLTPDGVDIDGQGVTGSPDGLGLAASIWNDYRAPLEKNAAAYGVPLELIVATICAGSRGDPAACHLDDGFVSDDATPDKVSPGLMQISIAAAREATHDNTIVRNSLMDPETSIRAGTACIKQQAVNGAGPGTNFDPPLVAIAYDVGVLQPAGDNAWGLRQAKHQEGMHADVFTRFFNDCFSVLKSLPAGQRPHDNTPSFWMLLNS